MPSRIAAAAAGATPFLAAIIVCATVGYCYHLTFAELERVRCRGTGELHRRPGLRVPPRADAAAVHDSGSDDHPSTVVAAFATTLAFTNHHPSTIDHFHADSRPDSALPTGHVLLQRGQRLCTLPGWNVFERITPSLAGVL